MAFSCSTSRARTSRQSSFFSGGRTARAAQAMPTSTAEAATCAATSFSAAFGGFFINFRGASSRFSLSNGCEKRAWPQLGSGYDLRALGAWQRTKLEHPQCLTSLRTNRWPERQPSAS